MTAEGISAWAGCQSKHTRLITIPHDCFCIVPSHPRAENITWKRKAGELLMTFSSFCLPLPQDTSGQASPRSLHAALAVPYPERRENNSRLTTLRLRLAHERTPHSQRDSGCPSLRFGSVRRSPTPLPHVEPAVQGHKQRSPPRQG